MCASTSQPIFAIYSVLIVCGIVLTIYTNARLLWITRKHRRQIAMQHQAVNAHQSGHIPDDQPTSSLKGVKTILIITAALFTSWIPSTLSTALSSLLSKPVPPYTTLALRYLVVCQSWWNAVIYWIINPSYRLVVMNILRRMVGMDIQPQGDRSTHQPSHMITINH